MNIAELSIKNKTTTLVLTVMILIGGYFAYEKLGRLEDPEFTIKEVLVITPCPGMSPEQVQKQVTEVIESAAQQLDQKKKVTSRSERGLSIVTVEMKDKYDKHELPQVFDELRRKINDLVANNSLPAEAGTPIINDDYGDVFGIFLAFSGEEAGYSKEELRKFADFLRRELLLVADVKKVDIFGIQPEAVYVEMQRDKLNQLGISEQQIFQKIQKQNLIVDAGKVRVGDEYIPIEITGEIDSIKAIGQIMISDNQQGHIIRLRDVANIRRGYIDPPKPMLRFDGKPAIGIAISTAEGGNVVVMGEAVKKRLAELESEFPVGIESHVISMQSDTVVQSIDDFITNLQQAVGIVIIVLLIFMGVRSGLIIGGVLVLTIAGTMIIMQMQGIILQRISLGALIIALGMLVDNAIVVTDGILVKIQKGEDRLQAAKEVTTQNLFPLLGATIIAVLAFAAIGTSDDSTGEFCGSLFQVLLISLMFSWVTAITITPLLCVMFLKPKKPKAKKGKPAKENSDPHGGPIYRGYRAILQGCLRFRFIPITILLVLLASSVFGFGSVKQSFFPASTRPQLMLDVWLPFGTHIEHTKETVEQIEAYLQKNKHITAVSSFVGSGAPRFILTYAPEKTDSGYAQLLVTVDDYRNIDKIIPEIQTHLDSTLDETMCSIKKFQLGPGGGGKIQVRLRGPDPKVLRDLAAKTQSLLHDNPNATGVYNDWREMQKIIRPIYLAETAERSGITLSALKQTTCMRSAGIPVGVYREGKRLIPIISRPPEQERKSVDDLKAAEIWTPLGNRMTPIRQVIGGFPTEFTNGIIQRRNRVPTLTIHADPKQGLPSELLKQVMPKIDKMFAEQNLPADYTLEWGGEYEDSRDAQGPIISSMMLFVLLMILMLIILFNSLRKPTIIMMTVPLALIGVTVGLLLTSQPFGFMALLGMLSLSGMLIKNAIVLIDQISLEIREGKDGYLAIIDSAISRARPVMMATATTVLGMLPLVKDAFYISMAVTIMFGLAFSAVLTLLFVPVMYSLFYRIRNKAD